MTASYVIGTAEEMVALGHRIGELAGPGDVIILSGDLGAGKTTLAKGIATGLGVTDQVTSPTFVISRVHRGDKADLVHVDAYRLGSWEEVDDLDLESQLDASVTVVEWGEGKVEMPHASRLSVRIVRSDSVDDERRVVELSPASGHWLDETALLSGDRP